MNSVPDINNVADIRAYLNAIKADMTAEAISHEAARNHLSAVARYVTVEKLELRFGTEKTRRKAA